MTPRDADEGKVDSELEDSSHVSNEAPQSNDTLEALYAKPVIVCISRLYQCIYI